MPIVHPCDKKQFYKSESKKPSEAIVVWEIGIGPILSRSGPRTIVPFGPASFAFAEMGHMAWANSFNAVCPIWDQSYKRVVEGRLESQEDSGPDR